MDTNEAPSREKDSFEKLNRILNDIRQGLSNPVWTHLRALCSITGQDILDNIKGRPLSAESPPPMRLAIESAEDLREMVNQVDITLNNLGHELMPDWYERQEEKTKTDPS